MSLQPVIGFFHAALECSFYHAPREPGLTYHELTEAGKRAGYQDGEIGDALRQVVVQTFGGGADKRMLPSSPVMSMWGIIAIAQNPEFRKIDAWDFVYTEMNDNIRAMGSGRAQLERNVIVERGVAQNIPCLDIEVAIALMAACGQLAEKDGILRPLSGRQYHPLPSQQRNQMHGGGQQRPNETRQRAYEIVKDIVSRRADGRPKHAEPFDAFADALNRLGRSSFRLWWMQMVAELRHSDSSSSPVSVLVLSAALVEGALTFVVKHARDLGLGVFGSTDFERDPRTWKIEDLVNSAAFGKDAAILDDAAKQRTNRLIQARQRIHAGRMLSEFPRGAPDLRPDEARDGKATAELVVRLVLDWLDKYPPTP